MFWVEVLIVELEVVSVCVELGVMPAVVVVEQVMVLMLVVQVWLEVVVAVVEVVEVRLQLWPVMLVGEPQGSWQVYPQDVRGSQVVVRDERMP